jgi:hyperosmotically inducible periplasmic protein
MRLIRRVLMLSLLGVGAVAAYNYWSDGGWPLRPSAASLDAATAKRQAARLANRAAAEASNAAGKVNSSVSEGTLTAKIKSKMALDDYVEAGAINVDTSGSVVTLSGRVGTAAERDRAERLARDTEGVSRVVNRLRVEK